MLAAACASPAEPTHAEIAPSAACVQCHAEDFARADDPPHVGVRPDRCGVCHTESAWHPDVLHHDWELTGAHAADDVECFDCHVGSPPVYEGTPDTCVGCHRDDELHTFPAHHTFGTDCASCHTSAGWRPSTHPFEPPPPPDAGPPDAGVHEHVSTDAGTHVAAHHDAGRRTRAPRPTTTTTPPPTTRVVDPPPDTTTRASRRY